MGKERRGVKREKEYSAGKRSIDKQLSGRKKGKGD